MFSWRTRRQIGALFAVLAFFGVFGAVSYWRFRSPASCVDNVKNRDELNVDCGGSKCEPCELKYPKNVSVIWTRAVPVKGQTYDVAAFIKNENETLASPSLGYRFTLLDGQGVIAERTGEIYLYPQERTYIVEANIEAKRPPTRVEFVFTNSKWQIYENSPPNIVIHGKEYRLELETASTSRGVVEADLFNNSPFDFRTVDVHFLLFDRDENLIGVNKTIIERFLTRTEREARTVWPTAIPETVTSVIVEPRVNTFTPTWLIQPQ